MSQPSTLRFFWRLLQPGISMTAFIALLVAAAVWSALRDPDDFDQICLLAVFFQMFAASTGYRPAALRGHFDPMLTAGSSRGACARAHAAVSVAPGLIVWLLLGAIAAVLLPARAQALLSASALIAVSYVSVVCWAITLPFQRYVGGVVWLVVIFTLAAGHQLHSLREAFLMAGSGWIDTVRLTAAALVAPVLLVANPEVAGIVPLGLVLAVAAAVWTAGAAFITRFDAVLRDPS
jgi:hypothetical protein